MLKHREDAEYPAPQVCDHAEACGCYCEGYAAGKDKTHSEVRSIAAEGNHAPGCGCEPCVTIRAVLAAYASRRT